MVSYKNILFCTDFSEDADIAFSHALDLAKRYGATLHIIHVPHSFYRYARHVVDEYVSDGSPGGEEFVSEELISRAEAALKERYEAKLAGLKDCRYVIKSGSPDVEIIRYAKKNGIDLIVMGALGKSELDRLVHGSTVTNVSKYAHCHVIAIKNPARKYTLPGTID